MSAKYVNTSPANRDAMALTRRYKDAYTVANVIANVGKTIKGIGAVLAGLIVIGALILSGEAPKDTEFLLIIGGVVSAAIIGLMFYVVGVLVAAQGQILQASLDSAVNSSPFLNNDHRSDIMSLSTAPSTSASVDSIQYS